MITVDMGQHFDRFTLSIRPSNLLFISMPPSSWMILIASSTVTSINGIIKLYV
ncbi:hypothetical protein [Pleurocapsa sp. CCALA 161]|uniref:hypothetical protein n=1 Tax=Pleurocapsa sp. CCALA 161 TaxID=2107688 RepID=UPI001304AA0F|nr:hypothetical protein [Pleurocapsa sp. CCALA 161]